MILTDLFITYKYKNSHIETGELEVWKDIYDGNINAELAIYGSSRAWVHFDTKILEDSLKISAYNFGMDGHHFWLQYLRHKKYLKYNKHPKKIILTVDTGLLERQEELYQLNQFFPYMLWDKDIIEFTSIYKGFNKEDYYIPLLRYYGRRKKVLSDLKRNSKENYRYKGYRGRGLEWNDDLKKAKAEMEYYKAEVDAIYLNLLKRFLKEAKNSGVEVIFVFPPEHIEGQKFEINRGDIVKVFRDLAKENNLTFLDYSNDSICRQKKYFYNSTHLNKKGATLFTQKLVADLRKIKKF